MRPNHLLLPSIICCLLLSSITHAYTESNTSVVRYEPIPTTDYLQRQGMLEREQKKLNFTLGFQGSYINPSTSAFTYATNDDDNFTIEPTQTFAFRVLTSFYFNDQKNDISASWFRYRSNNSNRRTGGGLFIPENPTNPIDGDYNSVIGEFDVDQDQINIEYGFRLPTAFCDALHSRAHVGVQYSRIKTQQNSIGIPAVGTNGSARTQSKYDGAGPRIGFDTHYQFKNNLRLSGSVAGSILYGNMQWNQDTIDIDQNIDSSDNKSSRTVPAIEAKFSTGYAINIPPAQILVEVGYEVSSYFNSYRDTQFKKQTLTNHGPFFGVRLVT